jgi:hypothetical protein
MRVRAWLGSKEEKEEVEEQEEEDLLKQTEA